jgi:hypothetical protein
MNQVRMSDNIMLAVTRIEAGDTLDYTGTVTLLDSNTASSHLISIYNGSVGVWNGAKEVRFSGSLFPEGCTNTLIQATIALAIFAEDNLLAPTEPPITAEEVIERTKPARTGGDIPKHTSGAQSTKDIE